MKVALATYAALPSLTDDDRPLVAAFAELGVLAEPVLWDDRNAEWGSYDRIIIRSCWDYHQRADEFSAWLQRIESTNAAVWNPVGLIRWNMDKRYLASLASLGVRTPATTWIRKGDATALADVLAHIAWSDAVVKPTISASATDTWRVSAATADQDKARYRALVDRGDVMIQSFIEEVVSDGEWSLVFIGGSFSHAVVKRPAAGDFRVQSEHGGTSEARMPSAALVQHAEHVVSLLPSVPLYARIDTVAIDGRFHLMEAECIEPFLYLQVKSGAYERFARAACEFPSVST